MDASKRWKNMLYKMERHFLSMSRKFLNESLSVPSLSYVSSFETTTNLSFNNTAACTYYPSIQEGGL